MPRTNSDDVLAEWSVTAYPNYTKAEKLPTQGSNSAIVPVPKQKYGPQFPFFARRYVVVIKSSLHRFPEAYASYRPFWKVRMPGRAATRRIPQDS
jgi:hypothetical protein